MFPLHPAGTHVGEAARHLLTASRSVMAFFVLVVWLRNQAAWASVARACVHAIATNMRVRTLDLFVVRL